MMKSPAMWAGALMILVGVVWFLQGVGALGGSPMTGVTLWAVVGPIVAVLGAGAIVVARRKAKD